MSTTTDVLLERVTGVPGVRGSLLISSPEGLVVAERVMDGIDGRAVAALAGSLMGRLLRTAQRAALRAPTFMQLKAETGSLLAAPGADGLMLVAIVGREGNVGLARLEMLDAMARLAHASSVGGGT